ncbi:MAG: tagaturonate reductase [Oscillospiraceae bacterium]|nr:tagaturonate reductase [Oscillospiraceae bacterium]
MKLCKETYSDYKKFPEKVLQFGEGNFLRAFVDWQIDRMNKITGFNGSVVVVQPIENGLVDVLNAQDGLFTLVLQGFKDGKPAREYSVINSISRGVNPYRDYDEYLKLAKMPELRFIISNTTEAGIVFDESDKFDDRPPKSFPAKLMVFLYERFKAFGGDESKGFIIIPCELIDRNGEELKKAVLKYAGLWNLGSDFINWLNNGNVFCCSLVDRIVTGYPKDAEKIWDELGYEDRLLDTAEFFHLWVIEVPDFVKYEFPAEQAGLNVKFVNDIAPYRERKVKILNGAHTALTSVALQYGIGTVKDALNDNLVKDFIKGLIYEEIIPSLTLPESELKEFAETVLERFANPFIEHSLASIALNSVSKFKTRNLPSLIDFAALKGFLPKRLVFSLASLITFYGDEKMPLNDDTAVLEFFKGLWSSFDGQNFGMIAKNTLGQKDFWEMDLNKIPNLTEITAKYIEKIKKSGIKEALKKVSGDAK